ncbi:MAG: DUF4984 domain-containing protein [Rikenellaceae bacterium]|nr:DUF4984 domain-containing protein [Rikenellaceae bacterium]
MKYLSVAVVAMATLLITSCDEEYVTYTGPEYVMFADSISTNMVMADGEAFAVAVASTVKCDYDRTFGVEVVDKGSNAIEGVHYTLESNSITIPAGEMATEVRVRANYEKIEATDSLGFVLRLVVPEQLEWDLYPNGAQTKVVMYKSCPFDVNNFTGWCVMTSLLLYDYPGLNPSYQRLVRSELHPTEENTIIVRNCFYDGYDVTLHFDVSNPAQPRVTMDEDEVLSDEASVFGMIHGDNKLLGTTPTYQPSFYNSCQRFVELWLSVYVKNLGEMVGTVGTFYNIFEWVSDEEAERLQREEGM